MSSNLSANLLNEFINKPILIKLRNNHTIKGTLQAFDDRMNLVLEKSQDILSENKIENLGKIILRGNNILIIAIPSK